MILRVAAELFADRGFAAVSITEIAEGVGISPGAMYRHFPGKESVLEAVLLDAVEEYGGIARNAVAIAQRHGRPRTVLRRAVMDSVQLTLDRPALLATYMREQHRIRLAIPGELAGRDRQQFRSWSRAVESVRPGIRPGEAAARLQASLGALVGMSIAAGHSSPPGTGDLVTNGIMAVLTGLPASDWGPDPETATSWQPEPSRRQALLTSAIGLFRERGYDGVGMDDIGQSVGISGPGVYAWFDSKSQILVDAFDLMVARLHTGLRNALDGATDAHDALVRLVHAYIDVVVDDLDLTIVSIRNRTALPLEDQRRIARRGMDLREPWRAAMAEVRPDLTAEQRAVVSEASIHLVRQVAEHCRDSRPSRNAISDLALTFLRHSSAGDPSP